MTRSFLRGAVLLALTDRRRSLNLLQGRPTPRWALTAVACCYALGLAVALAITAGAGTLAARFLPAPDADAAHVAAYGWLPALFAALMLASSVRLGQVREVMFPPDFHILRTLPVTAGQLLLVRLIAPALVPALGLGATATVFLALWLDGPPASLAVALVWGTILLGSAAQLAVTACCLLLPVRAARVRTLVLAAVAGTPLGLAVAPVAEAVGRPESLARALPELTADTLTALRPAWWNALVTGGTPQVVTVLCAPAFALAALAVAGCVRAGRDRVLRDADPHRALVRPGPGSLSRRRALAAWIATKEIHAVLRGAHTTTGGLRRIAIGGALLLGVGVGHLASGGQNPPLLPLTASAGVLVGLAALASDEAVQTSGLEAERGCMDLLRQSPLPFGALLSGKITVFAGVVSVVSAPAAIGWLMLAGHPVLPLAAVWLAACLASAVAAAVTALTLPPAESAAQTRITRSGTADVIQPLLTGVLLLPTLLTLPLLGEGHAATVPSAVTLLALVCAVRWLARQDRLPRRVHP